MALPLSICIPTFNRAQLLRRTLNHLREHPHLYSEIVISDNGSTDETGRVIAEARGEFPRVRVIRQATNRGAALNFQAVLLAATSDYLFLLSDDDALIPENFSAAFEVLRADPECVAVFGGYERCDADLGAAYDAYIPREGRFTKADKALLAENANSMTFPIVQRAIIQRHCFLDTVSAGWLRMLAVFLEHGVVRRVPFAVYRHAETPGRAEFTSTEPWFHDFLRGDWEHYVASIGPVDFALASQFVAAQTVHIYLAGYDYALRQNMPLVERSFLVRFLAYEAGRSPTNARKQIEEWEQVRLIAATIAHLADRISLAGPIERFVVERGTLNVGAMMDALSRTQQLPPVILVDQTELIELPVRDGDFVIAEYWRTLERRAQGQVVDPARQLAAADLVAALRLPGSQKIPLLHGPEGSMHFCLA